MRLGSILALAACTVVIIQSPPAAAQGPLTTLTYQGRLDDGGSPFSGTVDLAFTGYNAPAGGIDALPEVAVPGVAVTDGLFTVEFEVDSSRVPPEGIWFEISVDSGKGPETLSPRQLYSPAPASAQAAAARTNGEGSITFSRFQSQGATAFNATANIVVDAGALWQSFVPTVTGQLTSIEVGLQLPSLPGTNPYTLVSLYEGEGTGGPVLINAEPLPGAFGGSQEYTTSDGPTLTQGVQYTFEFRPVEGPGATPVDGQWGISTGNSYPAGRASTIADQDLFFIIEADAPGTPAVYITNRSALTVAGELRVLGVGDVFADDVDLPTGSVEAAEIADEPGISNGPSATGSMTSMAYSTLAAAAIETPGAGFIVAEFNGDININHSTGTPSAYDFGLATDQMGLVSNQRSVFLISSELPSAGYVQPISGRATFSVTGPGVYDIYALGHKRVSTSPDASVERARVTLTYYPTGYPAPGDSVLTDGAATPR